MILFQHSLASARLAILVAAALFFANSLSRAQSAPEAAKADLSGILIPGEPYGRMIESIEYRGLENANRASTERAVVLKVGEVYTRTAEQQSIANVWGLFLFENVAIRAEPGSDPQAVRVFVDVDEQPIVRQLDISGNTVFPDEKILDVLSFREGVLLPTNAAAAAEDAIKGLYTEKGYTSVSVRFEAKILNKDSALVSIRLSEGRRLRVSDIQFQGNESYTGFRLGFHMQTSQSWLFISNYYNEEIFEIDLQSVADFYRGQGYLKVQVREGESRVSEDGEDIVLIIIIDEGPRYTLREIRFEGFTLFAETELREPFERLLGKPFIRDDFQKAFEKMRHLYGNEGWTQAVFTPESVFVEGTEDQVDFVISINEGQRVTVGAITYAPKQFELPPGEVGAIEAFWTKLAPPVKPEVVLKRIELKSGEPLRLNQVEETERNLKRLRVFREVEVKQLPTDQPNIRDIQVETEPGDTAWLLFRASTSDSGTRAGFEIVERNLFGNADAVSLSAVFGQGHDITLSYLDRDFADTDFSLRYNAYYTERGRRGFDQESWGGSTTFSRKVRDRVYESYRLRGADVKIDPDDDVEADLDDYAVGAVMYRRAYDYRDDLEWPTEGFLLAGEAEGGYAGAGFLRLGFEYDRYQRLANSNFIWAASLAGDVMPFPSDRDDLGINERLFLGGRGSVRGFRGRGIAPKDTGEEDLALGGLTRVVLRNEVRFPLVGDALKGLVFFDAGFLGEDSFEFETPRASTGFGLRLLDERISVGADFGFALNAKSEDDTQVFQFAVDSGI